MDKVSEQGEVVIEPAGSAGAAVIWLHGLGADGHDFEAVVPMLALPPRPPVRFVFPHAPVRPVTINGGMAMRAWYDITGDEARGHQDESGIRASGDTLHRLIDREIARGIAPCRIVVAGFSQGGAIALHGGLRYPAALGGIVALSTYLPLADRLEAEGHPANRSTPILMVHGTSDTVIPLASALASRRRLTGLGYAVDWRTWPMAHSVCPEEIASIAAFLRQVLDDGVGDGSR